ncbi:MAG: DUF1846 domain-containing protein [Oscillospiraceae bacterium]|nr:DUF1846 domain-containing protein [Oscillospiraceae bacterium]
MVKTGFDNEKYLKMQSEKIKERIAKFGGKLYLEFGGKLFDDLHASRVLPGFEPDSKLRMLTQLKDQAEIVFAINAGDIEKNKLRGDLGITYDMDVLRLIDIFRGYGFFVGSVVLTQFAGQPSAVNFIKKLESMGIKTYKHYRIEGYPSKVSYIVSDEGFGKNEYVQTKRSLVVVTAPGPGSGKMAVCLSQLYHEHKRGVSAGYAKYETFPIWNLPLNHPVNLAYEAATADLNDINMIDPYHFEAYSEQTVNYNRDVEIFPVLKAIFTQILGESPYKSPTDMGVNMAGYCITDDESVRKAAKAEIIRRYYAALCKKRKGADNDEEISKIEVLMEKAGTDITDRAVAVAAKEKSESSDTVAAAVELEDGKIITGKTSEHLNCASAAILNSIKALGSIHDDIMLISPVIIEPIQKLKTELLGRENPSLTVTEVLMALSICAATNPMAQHALHQVGKLRGCEMHSTAILSNEDEKTLKKLGINLTSDAEYESAKLFHI